MSTEPKQTAGLSRRLAALIYDSLLVLAILFIASLPVVYINGGAVTAGDSISEQLKHYLFIFYLLAVCCGFYSWCWTHGGQTLGMSAWHIRTVSCQGQPLTLRQAVLRWLCGGFGLSNLSLLVNKQQAWHENVSNSITIITK